MTISLAFSQVRQSAMLRGVDANLIHDLFERKQAESPLLLLSRSEIRRNYRTLSQALPRATIHYAVKANNHPTFLDELHSEGCRFEVCSAQEIDATVRAGADINSTIHSHPIKSEREFDQAVAAGIRVFVVDNIDEINKLARYQDISLKIMIRYRINTNTKAVVDLQYKFGCTTDQVSVLAEAIKQTGHEVYGLCFHIGSQCIFSENYVRAIKTASKLITKLEGSGFNIRLLDIGGGFPVEYIDPIMPIDKFCEPIAKALDNHIRPEIEIICEPGRFIAASPVTLVCSVIGKAVRDGKVWYYLDDGLYSTFSGIVYDQCQYPVITDRTGQGKLSVLAGPTCDSFDVMYDGLMIPEHSIGDKVVFPLTGAYCTVSGSEFNSLKRPDYMIID
ncbi:MAG: type III PLP-dependent enzyme [candidate division Zixibacteria bacterium]|nr:type III PLP-dependent enzyme [candidate division Zixibacteria bacterium]